ncbi:hypothetical protein [Mobiluncus mulieris]|uniref:hypothetical protein n=1 Tax=Mobiluncus mulieris TaxID=2052 RepID=UPI0021E16693|nr:hypothetical protein [Mobiluncus mulieris]
MDKGMGGKDEPSRYWWLTGFPSWNPDGSLPMPVLTEEILRAICFGRTDPVTKRVSGGHVWGAIPNGRGKKKHSEFPADWTPETVRDAFYHLIQDRPVIKKNRLEFTGVYLGVEITIECFFVASATETEQVHMFPVRGRGVRLWRNGKEVKVSQKRRK